MTRRLHLAVVTSLLCSGAVWAGTQQSAHADSQYEQVARPARCAPGSVPETGFQGQVSLADRAAGFKGFSCNLKLLGQSQGEGASWQVDWYGDCAYYDTANQGGQSHPGSVVLDMRNPAKPTPTTYLSTPAMLHTWEGLKVNRKRGLLAGQLTGGPPFDIYDVKGDCRHPKLLASVPMPNNGHEGEWSPDGRTYWGSSTSEYHPIDVSDPRHPKQILTWKPPAGGTHGLSISEDGNRAYFVTIDLGFTPNGSTNGLLIADVSDIQQRRKNPQIRVLSHITWPEGAAAQATIPVRIGGKPYVVFFDELGAAGLAHQSAFGCESGLLPWGVPRIVDISNEREPKVISRLTLETNKPANCAVTHAETADQGAFAYDSHYCQVDSQRNATALACGYFNSGVRVFDIRDPLRPKEIAYYNPPGHVSQVPAGSGSLGGVNAGLYGSEHAGGKDADWCSQRASFHKGKNGAWQLWTTCQDSGFLVLELDKSVYPLAHARKS